MLEAIKKEVQHLIGDECEVDFSSKYADASTNYAIKNKKNADEIAAQIEKKIKEGEAKIVGRVAVQNNYINFYFDYNALFIELLKESLDSPKKGKKGIKAIIEYPSVNPNKPWHIGHLRNALIGDVVAKLFERAGYEVERINYIDDLGLQVAISLYDYLNENYEALENEKFDMAAGKRYVKAFENYENNEKVKKEVEELMKKMENGEKTKEARSFAEKCLMAQYQTAFAYGIFHDVLIWESDIVREKILEQAILLGKKLDLFYNGSGETENCLVVRLGDKEKVLIRSNGVPTYLAKDIAFHLWKVGVIPNSFKYKMFFEQPNGKKLYTSAEQGGEMNFGGGKIIVNIIGMEQKEEQETVKEVISKFSDAQVMHVAYEEVKLKEERFSGRKGTWLGYSADDLLKEAIKKAREQIKERFVTADSEKEKIAYDVGIGAIKFEILHAAPNKKFIFDWGKAINFEGDSSAYVQYNYARAVKILDKYYEGQKEIPMDFDYSPNEDEKELIKNLLIMEEVEDKALHALKPNLICEHLLKCASTFAKFYEKNEILKAEENAKAFRIALLLLYTRKVKDWLNLLGIDAPEKM